MLQFETAWAKLLKWRWRIENSDGIYGMCEVTFQYDKSGANIKEAEHVFRMQEERAGHREDVSLLHFLIFEIL